VTTSSCMNTADSSSTRQTPHKARVPHPRRVKQDNFQFGRDPSELNNPILSATTRFAYGDKLSSMRTGDDALSILAIKRYHLF
jgi:hypothetical protein